MINLKIGDPAPAFFAPNENGQMVSLKDFAGKKLVLFFYPADDTPTCTVEACNLRDNHQQFKAQGYEILGVSPDPVKSHVKFRAKHSLPFSLLSDPDQKLAEAYGVWGEKQLFGRKYMGVIRTTFVIDEQGKIAKIIEKVQSINHAEQIWE